MAGVELALGVEQIGIGALARQRRGRKRRDESLRGPGQHAADADLPFLEPPDQVQRLVGGDAAADDQGDPGLIQRTGGPGNAGGGDRWRCSSLRAGRREIEGHTFDGLPQDHPDFLLHGAAIAGRTQPQIGLDGLIEFSDGQAGHGQSRKV